MRMEIKQTDDEYLERFWFAKPEEIIIAFNKEVYDLNYPMQWLLWNG